jgi:hypothetical protein
MRDAVDKNLKKMDEKAIGWITSTIHFSQGKY